MALVTAQMALLFGVTRFPRPPNWNLTDNKVEIVAPGGVGGNSTTANAARGGAGGHYAWDVNLTNLGAGGIAVNILNTGMVWWNSSAQVPGCVVANSSTVHYPNGNAGGLSGTFLQSNSGGTGGGGAGGPNGIGDNSADVSFAGNPGSPGGAGNGGLAPPGQREPVPSWPLVNIGIGGAGKGGDPTSLGGAPPTAGAHAGGGGGGGGAANPPHTGGAQGGPAMIITWEVDIPDAVTNLPTNQMIM